MTNLEENYIISHGYAESGRLHLQQWIWKMQVGWDLHPSVKLPAEGDLKIADHGCGNGAWLLSLATSVAKTQAKRTAFHGFDIAPVHFAHPDNLPENFTFGVLDAFGDALPADVIGKFDMVHVRVFSAVVKNNDPSMLIKNAVKMLKPGGYFQWDEFDMATLRAMPPNDKVSSTATQEMIDTFLLAIRNAMNIETAWIPHLAKSFADHGLEVTADERMEVKKELRKPMSDSLLMVLEHIARLSVKDGRMAGTDKNWTELWDKAGAEIEQGVSVVIDILVVVGRTSSHA